MPWYFRCSILLRNNYEKLKKRNGMKLLTNTVLERLARVWGLMLHETVGQHAISCLSSLQISVTGFCEGDFHVTTCSIPHHTNYKKLVQKPNILKCTLFIFQKLIQMFKVYQTYWIYSTLIFFFPWLLPLLYCVHFNRVKTNAQFWLKLKLPDALVRGPRLTSLSVIAMYRIIDKLAYAFNAFNSGLLTMAWFFTCLLRNNYNKNAVNRR